MARMGTAADHSDRMLLAPALPEQSPTIDLSESQFQFIRRLAKAHAGIAIADVKRTMVRRRLTRRLAALGMQSFAEYCALLAGPRAGEEMQSFTNALTTNKTEFFRERHHFEHLARSTLARLRRDKAKAGQRRLRIWSAGCSTGEEPYSIAMTLASAMPDLGLWDVKILATDIDTDVVARAELGQYTPEEVARIPADFRARFVEPAEYGTYSLSHTVRSLVVFKPLNLFGPWPMRGPFDIIFCRNVVIYFDKPTQRTLFSRFADLMEEGATLYCGHSESLFGISTHFNAVGQSIYERIK